MGIENVAVCPAHRGSGAVDALLEHALSIGRERGRSTAQVLSLNGNERAERTWRRHGFTITTDYRDAGFEQIFGSPGMRLHTRALR